MLVDFQRVFSQTNQQRQEFQKKYDEIIAHAIDQKLCMVCEHAKTLEDIELSCPTTITVCEFSGHPIQSSTCGRFTLKNCKK